MIYSSINSRVHLLRTAEHEDEHTMLDFSQGAGGSRSRWGRGDFGVSLALVYLILMICTDRDARVPQIWSIRFSADQKEIVAGAGSGQIMVYDIEQKQRILNIGAHQDDGRVRSLIVCFD
jgi:WD repeat-containing protein 23